jgi:23S rRNA (adenine2030-N6)-methyltransferase
MNYRHAYHAGNFADVLKHAALVAVLAHLKKKEAPFAVIDTHGGRGIYELGGAEAEKTGEAKEGIVRLLGESALPGVLAPYAEIVRRAGEGEYPGSPLIAAKLLRAKDRLIAIEKHPEEFAVLASMLAPFLRARAIEGDGYVELKKLLPPPERRGLVLIDPPFEDSAEFQKASRALIEAHCRFSTGIYLFWYPAKEKAAVAAAEGEIMNAGMQRLLKVELEVGNTGEAPLPGRGPKLSSAGLLVVNPPYGFAEEMQAILPHLAEKLAQGPGAGFTCEMLGNRE